MDRILDRYVSFPLFLTYSGFLNLTDNFTEAEYLLKIMVNDDRFIKVKDEVKNETVFISKKSLLNWFSFLNFDLSQARVHRLSSQKIILLLNSIRDSGKWFKLPKEIVNFGKKYGLVANAWTNDQYVFPLSKIMAGLSTTAASILYDYMLSIDDWDGFMKQDPSKLLLESFTFIDQRVIHITFEREGLLDGNKKTLQAIGEEFHLTRERIRQIEEKFWKRIFHPERTKVFVKPFLCDFLKRQGSLIINCDDSEFLWKIFIANCLRVPIERINKNVIILAHNQNEIAFFNEPIRFFRKEVSADELANKIDLNFKPCFSSQELLILCRLARGELIDEIYKREKSMTKMRKVFFSLKRLGKPSHYSEVYEKYLKLFPEDVINEHSVHAMLSRRTYGIVWIGVRGTYALEEWGYQHPKKTLFETTYEIVEKIYQKKERPVPLGVITCELGKYRKIVNYASLYFATYFNEKLECVHKDHFIPKKLASSKSFKNEGQILDQVLRGFMNEIKTD